MLHRDFPSSPSRPLKNTASYASH